MCDQLPEALPVRATFLSPTCERVYGVSTVSFPHSGFLVKQGSPESLVRIPAPTAVVRPTAHGSETLTFFHVVLELLFFMTSPEALGTQATVLQACQSLYSTLYTYLPSER